VLACSWGDTHGVEGQPAVTDYQRSPSNVAVMGCSRPHVGWIRSLGALFVCLGPFMFEITPPSTEAQQQPEQAVGGFADLHTHQFANEGFGGLVLWGKPFDDSGDGNYANDLARALPASDYTTESPQDVRGLQVSSLDSSPFAFGPGVVLFRPHVGIDLDSP
jgi:hypothetical protein